MKRLKHDIVKAVRTFQNYVPILQAKKENAQTFLRKAIRVPHETDFVIFKYLNFDNKVFVDVGANRGQSIESARLFRPDIRVVSFEPLPSLASRLQEIYQNDPLIDIRRAGLSDTAGEFTIYTPVYRGYVYHGLSSLDRASAAQWISSNTVFFFDESRLTIKEETCQVRRLDDENLAPALIKIDVQGTEGKVLRGAVKTLERYKPVVLVERDLEMSEVKRILSEFGYSEYRLDGDVVVEGSQGGHNAIMMTSSAYSDIRARQANRLNEALTFRLAYRLGGLKCQPIAFIDLDIRSVEDVIARHSRDGGTGNDHIYDRPRPRSAACEPTERLPPPGQREAALHPCLKYALSRGTSLPAK
jgi:FkbM family methyltransferase